MKIGRNQHCPCGSGRKYKHCCKQRGIDFRDLSHDEWMRHLCVRGKNIYFINKIGEALQLDSISKKPASFSEFVKLLKRAITPQAVRKIHLAIPEIWPDKSDLDRCLKEESSSHSGLFIGSYLFDVTAYLLNRHALYDTAIILIDPFHDPRIVAPEYNPVHKPEEHITSTFHYALLWMQLLPWIESGIIKVIRDPGDFDYPLRKSTWEIARARSQGSDELRQALENQDRPEEMEDFFRDQFALTHSDEFWLDKMKDLNLSESEIRQYLKKRRDESLYYVDVGHQSQMLYWSTGTNYEMGKHICQKTKSHIITDLSYRWTEIEYDRRVNGVQVSSWTPFAKAIQGAKLKHLNGVAFDDLLKLRKDGYLEDMRAFLRRVWIACSTGEEFYPDNAENLSAELTERINSAEAEWKKIDSNLVKWFGSESILGTAIGVSAGVANWIPAAAVAAAGAVNLVQSTMERHRFITRYPAAFFVKSIRNKA